MKGSSSLLFDERDVEERFTRGSGPGGQNVNKVATAVELRLHIGRSTLSDEVKARLREIARARITADDELVIGAREHRTQGQNRDAARARLSEWIRRASVRPKARRKTKPSGASRERRLEGKRRRSETKRARAITPRE